MAIQLKLLAFWVFSLFLITSLCHGKNIVTVKVIGQIHCKDCTSLGINVLIHCKSGKQETGIMGNGPVDKEGKFTLTLSADFTKDGYDPNDGCFAELHSPNQPTLPCPLRNAQTASVKIHHTNTPMILTFSPITCQSAFFLPHPKFKFCPTSPPPWDPPIEYAPPPPEYLTPPPLYLPPLTPVTPFQSPQQNQPTFEGPMPAPTFQSPNPVFEGPSPPPGPIYITPPPFYKQTPKPPPKAFRRTPFLQTPIPTAPPVAVPEPPTQFVSSPYPNPYPPRSWRKTNPIPRAPPVPQLPPNPSVPRKYFNSPNSKAQPPHSA